MEDLIIKKRTNIFAANYFIGLNQPLYNKFIISLSANTPNESLNGETEITVKTTPPINIANSLKGNYKYVCIEPEACHILITAKGYPKYSYVHDSGIERPAEPIFHFRMILSEDWKSGIANYDYKDKQGQWHSITDAPVKRI